MSIETDSTPLEDPKNTETCNVFAIYKLLANRDELELLTIKYENTQKDFGYGHAKQMLFELLVSKFKNERERYVYFMNNKHEIDKALQLGAAKAQQIANEVLSRVRQKLGYSAI